MRLKPLAIYWLVLWALVQAVQPQETLLRCPGSELATINLVSDGETINIGKDDCRIHQTTEAGGPAQVGSLRIAGEGSWDLGWDVAVASIGSGALCCLSWRAYNALVHLSFTLKLTHALQALQYS